MRKKIMNILGLLVIGLVATVGAAAAFGFGWHNDDARAEGFLGQGARMMAGQAGMDEMHEAMETGDYDAFIEAHEAIGHQPRWAASEEDFQLMADMHEAMINGDYETADQIREELGMPERGQGRGRGMMRGAGFVDADGDGLCDNMQ